MKGKEITFFIIDDLLIEETDMSDDNEIYPLAERYDSAGNPIHRYSVNQRLTPIFKALADDPDGFYAERQVGFPKEWAPWPIGRAITAFREHDEPIRLVRTTRTITVEIDEPADTERVEIGGAGYDGYVVQIPYEGHKEAEAAVQSIRKAMERK